MWVNKSFLMFGLDSELGGSWIVDGFSHSSTLKGKTVDVV